MTTLSFKFQTLGDVINMLKPSYFMAKIDLGRAYRSVPIHPSNFTATGLKWRFTRKEEFSYYYDTRLPFGAKYSPEISQTNPSRPQDDGYTWLPLGRCLIR